MNFKTLDFVELSTEEMDACKGGLTIKLFNWVIYDSDLGWFPESQYDLNH